MPLEAGYFNLEKPLVSLGGLQAKPGFGRRVTHSTPIPLVTPGWNCVAPSNPKRLFLTIYAIRAGHADHYSIALGDPQAAVQPIVDLYEGDFFQIDRDLAWTGAVSAYATGADPPELSVCECEVQA